MSERLPIELSRAERNELHDCERVIERGLDTWRQVGEALATIRDRKLFRETHASFDAYARDRWKLGKSRAYQLVAAASYAAAEEAAGRIAPANEHQVRQIITRRRVVKIARETPESLASRLAGAHGPAFLRTLVVRLQRWIELKEKVG